MRTSLKTAALALVLPATLAVGLPAAAAVGSGHSTVASAYDAGADTFRNHDDRRYRDRYYSGGNGYAEPVYQNTQTWRGNDGRYYCKKKNGTTGLLVGGAAGALLGREIAGRGDNTLGMIIGGVGGALLGREVERKSGSRRCR